jgi:hypothetical protein
VTVQSGYQPGTVSPSSRRADFDLRRRLTNLEEIVADIETGGGGTGGPVSYVHNQATVSATWSIAHGLGWYPNVTVIDSAGTTVEGDITHTNSNLLTIHFSGAFTGVAYLS